MLETSTPRKIKPEIFDDSTLDEYRDKFIAGLTQKGFKKRDLAKDADAINRYTAFYQEHGTPFAKKVKKQKVGLLGMDELTKIVLDLNQDVKQIKEAQSLEGARNWVAKHGPDLYTVDNADINGDDIPDIVVKNKDGKNVIVNGYTTGLSNYPYRYSYYTQYPTQDARKQAREEGMTFRNYINSLYNPQFDEYGLKIQVDRNGNPLYGSAEGLALERRLRNSGYKKIIKPKDKTPYQAFTAGVIKPLYDVVKKLNELQGVKTESTLLTKAAADIWNQTILIPAMIYVYGEGIGDVSDAEWKKLRNKKEVKAAILDYVKYYLKDTTRIIEFVDVFVAACRANGNPVDEGVAELIPQFLKCRLLEEEPPNLEDKDAWARIDQEFDARFNVA